MADPIIADHFRVLAVFERTSGLPEDQVVNSWAFRNDQPFSSMADVAANIRPVLDAFYFGDAAVGGSIADYITPDITALNYRIYNLGDAPVRTPFIDPSQDYVEAGGGTPLPEEAAVVMSLKSEDVGPRERGRLYLGPLRSTAIFSPSGRTRVSSTFQGVIADRAEDVINTTENVTWVFISQADAAAKVVASGYVDNALDTQRSRGIAPDARVTFGAAPVEP
uniref:Uncharacterized protein n=1 Tax=uncultured prokaryote TaxID=198431 RepID=A0A0H5Q8F0_9ZZZZ|nr:hypothetical protein [uncultured prokaryote]